METNQVFFDLTSGLAGLLLFFRYLALVLSLEPNVNLEPPAEIEIPLAFIMVICFVMGLHFSI